MINFYMNSSDSISIYYEEDQYIGDLLCGGFNRVWHFRTNGDDVAQVSSDALRIIADKLDELNKANV